MKTRIIAAVALAIAFATPVPAQTVLKVGSTPTGIPFTFLDTRPTRSRA